MKRATAVIGAAFGDEGKGLMVDYHAARRMPSQKAVVVRFNGGAQAGHTIQTPDGRWHVFSHIGAGTFAGADTFLSKHFIANPLLWSAEMDVLGPKMLGLEMPSTFIDPNALLSTPYDMLINKAVETARGAQRHGSCGLGINETIQRARTGVFTTTVSMIMEPERLQSALSNIRDDYVSVRLEKLGYRSTTGMVGQVLGDARRLGLEERFMAACHRFRSQMKFLEPPGLANYDHIVFEGAQGLLLDQDHEFFPHVTHSYTGLRNVLPIAVRARVTDLEVNYVTRAYATRHGAGPFPSEDPRLNYFDATNDPDEFQGTLRFGRMDIPLIKKAIWNDLNRALSTNFNLTIHPRLTITHLDQTGPTIGVSNGEQLSPETVAADLGFGEAARSYSYGPTREDIKHTPKNQNNAAATAPGERAQPVMVEP